MLRNAQEIKGFTIQALDGEIGNVHDFFFDDLRWQVRYLVIDTGNWLSGRKVLVIPKVAGQADMAAERLPVSLSQEAVEESPDANLEKPVSRQYETALHEHYSWDPYWLQAAQPTTMPGIAPRPVSETPPLAPEQETEREEIEQKEEADADSHLRSMEEVNGYDIQARDGEIGHVETFIVDDETWAVQYLVIDTRDWLPGKKVLLAPTWIEEIDWLTHDVAVDLTQETIKNSPEYDPSRPLNREYETELYEHYDRPKYWLE
jgi:uncharacterized protein YrrD